MQDGAGEEGRAGHNEEMHKIYETPMDKGETGDFTLLNTQFANADVYAQTENRN